MDASYWDRVADKSSAYHLEPHIAQYKKREHITLISQWCGDLSGKRILKTDLYEEAFGDDSFIPWLSDRGASEIIGVDISPVIVERARSRVADGKVECLAADICQTPLQDESFDIIISNSTIDNLEKKDHVRAMKELERLLKPEGILILTLDNAHNPLYGAAYYISKWFGLSSYYQCKCFTLKSAKHLVGSRGCSISAATAIVHIPTPFNKIACALALMLGDRVGRVIEKCVALFAQLGNIKTKYLTGWFLALKVVKDD